MFRSRALQSSIWRLPYLSFTRHLYSLYLVTHRRSTRSDAEFIKRVEDSLCAGVVRVQIRDENEDIEAFFRTIDAVKKIVHAHGAQLIINNRVDLALAVGADGVHLGQRDFPYQEARRLLGERAIIGLTVDTWQDLIKVEAGSVDYLGVQVFPSKITKPGKECWGLEGLKRIRDNSAHKIVAIGGIDLDNLESVSELLNPDDSVAMVNELWRGDSYALVQKANQIFKQVLERRK
jgi:thiamine-phosphate pyrophosphorylase